MKTSTDKLKTAIKSTLFAASLAVTSLAMADGNAQYSTDEKLKDAWLDGKVETALLVNRHLNNFTIDTDVKKGKAILSGTVNSEIDRDLAAKIAKSIEGVSSVDNKIIVKKAEEMSDKLHVTHEHQPDKTRNFGTWYDDATTTASIKSELLWNSETSGLDVNVDTAFGVVTLNGVVETAAEKDLIEQIAQNTPGVKTVNSEIEVDSNS
ncbi:BON domain-containing protein [Marinicella litoralis]|uniref:Osmotically-inducible protein OsmY n=1 Tax=Marinicella litoralis TaxID=644220 RepID=A0A4R6XV16_9GAMM|nr:BON domain-containing protein [Marinicella litoralis]TDR23686.1 osmotically-inducible protein OsmY [Marinicella litoralis]